MNELANYIPRLATDSALLELEKRASRGSAVALLVGPPGIGKTHVLRVLEARLEERFRCLYVPHAVLGSDDVCRWVLGLLGEPAGHCPEMRLGNFARELARRGSGLVLLIDEATLLAPETARRLADVADAVYPGLRLVFAGIEDPRLAEVEAALAQGSRVPVERIWLDQTMSHEETLEFAAARLARRGSPLLAAERTLETLHEASEGIPIHLERLLSAPDWDAPPDRIPRSHPAPLLALCAALFLLVSGGGGLRATPEHIPLAIVPSETPHIVSVTIATSGRAEVTIDGRLVGTTPLASLPLITGEYLLHAQYADGHQVRRRVQVDDYRRHFRL